MRTIWLSNAILGSLVAEITRRGRLVRLPASGRSMVPTIVPGDRVTIAPATGDTVEQDDIVMVTGPRSLLHRVARIAQSTGQVVTRGDACAADDPPTPKAAVVGKVVEIERPLRTWLGFWARWGLGAGAVLSRRGLATGAAVSRRSLAAGAAVSRRGRATGAALSRRGLAAGAALCRRGLAALLAGGFAAGAGLVRCWSRSRAA